MTTLQHTFDNLAAIAGFVRATGADVPEPTIFSVFGAGRQVSIGFATYADFLNWAVYLGATVQHDPLHNDPTTMHHSFASVWEGVTFAGYFLEPIAAEAAL